MNTKTFSGWFYFICGTLLVSACIVVSIAVAQQSDNPLTGNWAASSPSNDGFVRKAYFNLKQDGVQITGTIRATQFFYKISKSTGGPEGFTLEASMMDGKSERKVTYEGKLIGNELQIGRRNRPDQPITFQMAQRGLKGEGALPPRVEPPALHKVPYNGLAKTPPMGWNSWNKFAGRVDDATVRGMADAMASNGMKDAGYVYINIDDTWEGRPRRPGQHHHQQKIPRHEGARRLRPQQGLKLGIYSSPGPNTCAGYEGSYGHEEQDAQTYAAWGIDYLKYDWCGARNLYTDEEMPARLSEDGRRAAATQAGRSSTASASTADCDVWKWGPDVGGNLWRTTGDIRDTWDSMTQHRLQPERSRSVCEAGTLERSRHARDWQWRDDRRRVPDSHEPLGDPRRAAARGQRLAEHESGPRLNPDQQGSDRNRSRQTWSTGKAGLEVGRSGNLDATVIRWSNRSGYF